MRHGYRHAQGDFDYEEPEEDSQYEFFMQSIKNMLAMMAEKDAIIADLEAELERWKRGVPFEGEKPED